MQKRAQVMRKCSQVSARCAQGTQGARKVRKACARYARCAQGAQGVRKWHKNVSKSVRKHVRRIGSCVRKYVSNMCASAIMAAEFQFMVTTPIFMIFSGNILHEDRSSEKLKKKFGNHFWGSYKSWKFEKFPYNAWVIRHGECKCWNFWYFFLYRKYVPKVFWKLKTCSEILKTVPKVLLMGLIVLKMG